MRLLSALSFVMLLAGCVSTASLPPLQHYVMEDLGEAAQARHTSRGGGVLLVQPTSVSAFYDTQRLAYSRAAGQRAYYQFAAWTERPGRAFSELLRRRLKAASTTDGVKGDLILHTRVEEIYHDASTSPGSVKIEVSAELVDAAGRIVAQRQRFSRSVGTRDQNAAAAVAAANQAVTEVLDDIAGWIEGSAQRTTARLEHDGFRAIRTVFVALAPAPGDFPCETLPAGASAGTVEAVREVQLVSDMHAFDPGVLEHPVHPETAEELVIRLDAGPFITFTNKDPQRLRAGQRVRVILTGSDARVELDLQRCWSPLAYAVRE